MVDSFELVFGIRHFELYFFRFWPVGASVDILFLWFGTLSCGALEFHFFYRRVGHLDVIWPVYYLVDSLSFGSCSQPLSVSVPFHIYQLLLGRLQPWSLVHLDSAPQFSSIPILYC